jgi:hypothetical protein
MQQIAVNQMNGTSGGSLMENGFSSLQAGNDGVHQAERADTGRSGNAGSGQSAAPEHPAAAAVIASKHQVKKRSFGSSFLLCKENHAIVAWFKRA